MPKDAKDDQQPAQEPKQEPDQPAADDSLPKTQEELDKLIERRLKKHPA